MGVPALSCLTFDSSNTQCFDAASLSIRMQYASDHMQLNFNDQIRLHSLFIAGEVEILGNHKLVQRAKLTKIEQIDDEQSAQLDPPADAKPLKFMGGGFGGGSADYQIDFAPRFAVTAPIPKENVSGDVGKSFLIVKRPPSYPPDAYAAHIAGTVVLEILVGAHGQVKEARALGGPGVLRQAAIDAVREWIYRPDIKNGVAIDMETTVDVSFPWRQ
jgi:TonB family protein